MEDAPSHVHAYSVTFSLKILYPACDLCNTLGSTMSHAISKCYGSPQWQDRSGSGSSLQVHHTLLMIIPGNKVHHFKTGREGTVVKMLDNGWQMTIEFDKWNQAGMPDGAIEVRRVSAFNLGSAWALRRHYGGQCALCRRCA